ncbi:hypothetical protein [Merismopedia glauca]|uniref:Uncharacterized protein n=1 Tax=Merismopedia glauca CCAP 1448/3 TaxID=1296344 RepID=A0A2T1C9G3_9CYAN|nr:hypothetical protein [Merismopedia glauca]PSB04874.1 hypothetical protein C7B64_01940 [Merismopedia glauca CCAP 1448/3]
MNYLFAAEDKATYWYIERNLGLLLVLLGIILNYLGTAAVAELKYTGNAKSSIDLINGKEIQELDSDRLSLEYTEAIAPIIVSDAQAQAQKFLEIPTKPATDKPLITSMTVTGKYAAQIDYGWLQGVNQAEIQTSVPSSTRSPILSGRTSIVQKLTWSDKLTVLSKTIPRGKTVSLKFTLKFTRHLRKDDLGEVKAIALWGISSANGINKTEIAIADDNLRSPLTTTESKIIQVKVGQTLNLVGSLELGAKITNPNSQQFPRDSSAMANAENTARFYIDPVDADISYTTESKQTYLSEVRSQKSEVRKKEKQISNLNAP